MHENSPVPPPEIVAPDVLPRGPLEGMMLKFRDVLLAREYLPTDQVRAYQQGLMKRLVEHALARLPSYVERLKPAIRNGQLDPERWSEIPLLTRVEVQSAPEQFQARRLPYYFGHVTRGTTSGSTGRPVQYREDDLHVVASEAQLDRAFTWWRMDGRKTLATFMSTYDEVQREGKTVRYGWRLGSPTGARPILELMVDIDGQIDWLKSVQPHYLSTRGGAHIAALAQRVEERGEKLHFERILSGGSALTGEARQLARRVFKSKVVDLYGASEAGLIAYDCPHCRMLHCCDESILVEVLREDGSPCREGETGRVVLTPLYNYAMSLIRYEIGDYATRGPDRAPCGRGLSSLVVVVGRYRNLFVLRDGRVVQPYASPILAKHLAYRQLQMVQTDYEAVEIRYVPEPNGKVADLPAIEILIRRLLGPDASVRLVPVDRFEPGPAGKFEETLSLVAARQKPAAT